MAGDLTAHIADRFVVVLDANVLYPFWMRDVLFRFHAAGLYRARWTDRIIEEWRRSVLRQHPDAVQSLERQHEQMRLHFDDAWVEGFETLIAGIDLPADPDDRHVVAAAIRCGAQHIVTQNIRHFPVELLEPYDIEAIDADSFLCRTFELYPGPSLAAIRQMRLAYKHPSFGPAEFLMEMNRKQMPRLSALLRDHRGNVWPDSGIVHCASGQAWADYRRKSRAVTLTRARQFPPEPFSLRRP